MFTNLQFWIETVAIVAAVLFIPTYLGFVHASAAAILAYVGVGSVAMATGEQLQFGSPVRLGISDLAIWCGVMTGLGGSAYLLALLLI
jgi:hypothetical protein